MRKNINDLVGEKISHIKYGECQVLEVIDRDNFKFSAKIITSGEIKLFIFSTQFFSVEGDFDSANIKPVAKKNKERQYKPVDYNKFRNHPFIKELDRREAGRRIQVLRTNDDDDDETEEFEEK